MRDKSGVFAAALGTVMILGDPASANDSHHVFLAGKARAMVSQALEGAARRLSRDDCRRVFCDFTDIDGRSLMAVVDATAKRPEALLAGLYFVDGDGTPQCRGEQVRLFTARGSHVVYVCARRFAQMPLYSNLGEILVIHELLHALGLGENPPSSAEITRAVYKRCGREGGE